MSQSHFWALVRNIPKGVALFFVNPRLALSFAKKFFCEIFAFPFFSSSLKLEKRFGDVDFALDYSWMPNEQKYRDFIKRPFFEIYYDLYEIHVRQAIERYLHSGQIFIDVGASAGYFSAIAAAKVGKNGQVHCFEPTPFSFEQLEKLKDLNPGYSITINNAALGEQPGRINMQYADVTEGGATSLVPDFMRDHHTPVGGTTNISVLRLDEYLRKCDINPDVIKIDVEGYEFVVLKGLEDFFKKTNHRPVIICEIQPTAYRLLGYTLQELVDYMKKYGYRAYDAWRPNRAIDLLHEGKEAGFDVIWRATL